MNLIAINCPLDDGRFIPMPKVKYVYRGYIEIDVWPPGARLHNWERDLL